MKKYHNYHTNQNWRKCLTAVNEVETGASTLTISLKTGFTKKQTYGFLYRLKESGKIRRKLGAWYPVEL